MTGIPFGENKKLIEVVLLLIGLVSRVKLEIELKMDVASSDNFLNREFKLIP